MYLIIKKFVDILKTCHLKFFLCETMSNDDADAQVNLASLASDMLERLETINKEVPKERQSEVIQHLGGLNTVIYLCLSNPNCTKFVNEEKLECLITLLNSNGILDDSDDGSSLSVGKKQTLDETKNDISTKEQTASNDIQNRSLSIISTNSSNVYNKENAIFSNFIEFYTHSMIIMADVFDNSYQTKLHLTFTQIQFIVERILIKTWFPLCAGSFVTISYSLGQLYWYLVGYDWFYSFIITTTSLISIFICSLYILSANNNVCILIFQTFDFWYKTYSILLGIITGYVVRGYLQWYPYVILNTCLVFVAGLLFIFDAIFISNTNKNIFIIMVVYICVYEAVHAYLTSEDVYWNPFDSDHTRISVKSIMVSSNINLVLFVLKPIFSQISRHCRHIMGSSNSNINNVHDKMQQRSHFLHKRPIIQWKIKTKNNNNNITNKPKLINPHSNSPSIEINGINAHQFIETGK